MKKRDLFRLLIKLFALYALITNLFTLLTQIPFFFTGGLESSYLGFVFLGIAMILAFLYMMFKPDVIIDFLRLDKGFDDDETHPINIDGQSLVKVGLVIIAGYFFLKNFSAFVTVAYSFIKSKVSQEGYDDFISDVPTTTMDFVVIILNLVVAWLIMTNVATIARYVFNERKSDGAAT